MWNRLPTLRSTLMLALAVALAACGAEAAPADDIAEGTYTLETANGEPLPAIAVTRQDPSGTWEARIQSGSLILENGAYEARFIVDYLLNGEPNLSDVPVDDDGSYTVSGNRVTLTSSDPAYEPAIGTLEGDVLTIEQSVATHGSFTAVFRR